MVKDELGLCVVKRQNLGKAMEEVKSHASGILTLTLQLTDVEEHLSLVETSLQKRSKEIESKEIELLNRSLDLEERAKVVEAAEAKVDDLQIIADRSRKEIEEMGKQMGFLKKQIESCVGESKAEEMRLTQVKKSVKDCMVEQRLKASQVAEMVESLRRTQGELSVEKEHLCRTQIFRRKLEEEIKRKTKDLTLIGERIVESENKFKLLEERLDVQQKLIATRSSELISKEKELDSLQESIRISNCDLDSSEQKIQSFNSLMMETSQQIESKAKELEIIQKLVAERTSELNANLSHFDSIKLLIQEHGEELVSREKKYDEMSEAIRKLEFEIECKEKTLERAESSIQQLSRKQHASENKLLLTERDLETTTAEIESKKKELQAMEDEQEVRLRASLKERKQELIRKEKQLDIRSKKIEVKEKELDAQQEKIDHRDHKLKSTEQKSPKCVKDSGVKAKTLSSLGQHSKSDQSANLLQNANPHDEKSLQLLLRGHLKKCPQLQVDISSALKASSDPAKLVLDTIQGLYTAHQRMAKTKLDQSAFRWSSICLLECLMGLPPKPKPEVEGEAIKFATEWKNTTLVKAENPVEVLGFLHFLAAFSLAYTFDAEKVQNLFDLSFLRKYAPSLCKALGVSALAPVNNVLSSDDKLEQLPSQAPITNRSASRSPGVQEMAGLSQLDCEDGLMDNEIPTSLSHSEVFTGLQLLPDPARFVLNLVEEALLCSNHQGELGLAECTVKNVVIVLEELTLIPRSIDSRLHLDASKLASQWNESMRTGTRGRVSSLEALAFLQFIVAYRLMDRINREETVKLALSVTRFKQAPKLFDSLGLSNAIPNVVMQLLHSRQYIPAIRFMFSFNLQTGLSPLNLLNEEINGLRRSAMDTRRFNPQAEDKDAGKLRDIIDLIADFKLEIDLPGDLIAKFVLSQESLNQNQCFASPVSLQPQERTREVQMQVAHMATYGPNTSQTTNFRTPSPNPQVIGLETYQARGSSVLQGPSPHQQAGFKRPRVEPCVLRPRFEPPRTGRF